MKKIIIDTNFLLVPEQFRIDIFSEIERIFGKNYELYIIDKTIDELNKIITNGGKDKTAAKMGLQFIEKRRIKPLDSQGLYVDSAIIRKCHEDKEMIVATNDIRLKRLLKHEKFKVIELRQKKYLVFSE